MTQIKNFGIQTPVLINISQVLNIFEGLEIDVMLKKHQVKPIFERVDRYVDIFIFQYILVYYLSRYRL